LKIAVFWVVAPCSLVEVYQRFRGPSCLHHQGDDQKPNGMGRQKRNIISLKCYLTLVLLFELKLGPPTGSQFSLFGGLVVPRNSRFESCCPLVTYVDLLSISTFNM
jgi:hypothetical protein